MNELLKIIYETEEILRLIKVQCQSEKEQMIQSVIHDLSDIDHKLDLHYRSKGMDDNTMFRP